MDLPVAKLGSCPAWVNANEQAKGYYLPEYRGGLLDALIGAGLPRLSPPERVDVIGGGAIVVQELAAILGARAGIDSLTVSEHDILDGIAQSVLT